VLCPEMSNKGFSKLTIRPATNANSISGRDACRQPSGFQTSTFGSPTPSSPLYAHVQTPDSYKEEVVTSQNPRRRTCLLHSSHSESITKYSTERCARRDTPLRKPLFKGLKACRYDSCSMCSSKVFYLAAQGIFENSNLYSHIECPKMTICVRCCDLKFVAYSPPFASYDTIRNIG
jgi:hypothetical protein